MMIAAKADVPVAFDVTVNAWVIDVKPAAQKVAGAILVDVNSPADLSEAGGTTGTGDRHVIQHCPTAGKGGRHYGLTGTPPAAGCAVLPVRRVLMSVRRSLVRCSKAAHPARGRPLMWWWRRSGITPASKKKASLGAERGCSQSSEKDRDEKLREVISYCKMTMGITAGD